MTAFSVYAQRKEEAASSAALARFATLEDHSASFGGTPIGNGWTRRLYDGDFHLSLEPDVAAPAISLVFVQSRDGNTGAGNPDDLGGGPLDKHLIYEGLSRVACDAVMAGAKTVEGGDVFFSVWRPELVELRESLGLPRHPAQIIVTGRGCVDLENSLIFHVPEVKVFILSSPDGCARLAEAASRHPSVELVTMNDGELRKPLEFLRAERGIRRISAVGGRTTATSLLDAGLVQDILLTTTEQQAGEPGTPMYVGDRPPALETIVKKRGTDPDCPIVLEHLAISTSLRSGSTRRP